MTVIVALRAGPAMGVACADREITYSGHYHDRKFQSKARKIVHLGGSYFAGFAGDVGMAERIIYTTKHAIAGGSPGFQDVVSHLKKTYDALRQAAVRDHVTQQMGISWDDYVSGRLSPHISEETADMLKEEARDDNDKKTFNIDLIVCGIEENGIGERRDFSIATYRAPGVLDYSKYSDTIGISDMADIVTSEFLESVRSREPYLGIDRCARVVMEAKVRAERVNPGVGRRSQLVWVDSNGNFHETSERETALLNAVVRLKDGRNPLVTDETVDRIFFDIVGKPRTKEERTRATDTAFQSLAATIPPESLYKHVFFGD